MTESNKHSSLLQYGINNGSSTGPWFLTRAQGCLKWHNGIQHNDTQHDDIQHYDTQHNDTQHNDTLRNDIQHNNK